MKKIAILVVLITVICTVISGAFFAVLMFDKPNQLSEGAERLVMPIQSMVTKINNYFYDIKNLNVYKTKSKLLEEETGKLKYELQKYEGLIEENQRLRDILDFSKLNPKLNMVPCEVVAKSASDSDFYIKVNKGKKHGISLNDTAILNHSLIGRVSHLGENWSKISLILSPKSAVGVFAPKSGNYAIAEGDITLAKNGKIKIKHVQNSLIVGETVYTSGEKSIYPKGLLIGTVSEIKENYAILETAVSVSSLSEIMIVRKGQE